jgi:tetratricopeptide (TPR) repeat protein
LDLLKGTLNMNRLVTLTKALLPALVFSLATTGRVHASGSKEEPPQTGAPAGTPAPEAGAWGDDDKETDKAAEAVERYNDGVKKMNRAKEYWSEAESDKDRKKAIKWFEKAARKFSEAIELNPDFPEALNNLGFSLRLSGRYDESLTHYSRAIELKPDFMEAHEYRGRAHLAVDSVRLAKVDYEWLVENKHVEEAQLLKEAIDAWVMAKAEGKTISVEKASW